MRTDRPLIVKYHVQQMCSISSSGQSLESKKRELISPATSGEGVYQGEFGNKRTNVVRFLPNGFHEKKLRKLEAS
ncbi:hypothetical protein HS1genome_0699 [Sulfodiicoccus acidiphilus]|uniref:Uncharacterized protein n=1 Tax=Sulfodiicoccus acidiphilus TaxID=1670455 RepID=A0A348B2A8_9CREN|nr:hypothetical protein HS1genome_0699 [Sulfodiicoccus acidiphilus]GGT90358.1 hypothetical protein GCM10007116_05210 [Sulfodiicoccus acidiphilus]